MTRSIERDTVRRAREKEYAQLVSSRRGPRAITAAKIATGVAVVACAAFGSAAAVSASHHVQLLVGAATCAVLSAIGGAVLAMNTVLANRRDYYRQGQLDGWIRGWRGQPPEADVPGFE